LHIRLLTIAAALLASGLKAAAQDKKESPFPSHLPLATEACFGRIYDQKHLAAHPRQRVTGFHLFRDFTPDNRLEDRPFTVEELKEVDGDSGIIVTAYVRFRNRPGLFFNSLHCGKSTDGKEVRCGIDCDGGSFKLRTSEKSLLLENEGFVVVGGCGASEDEQEMADYVKPGADDKLFRLDPKPVAECRALADSLKPHWAKLGKTVRERLDRDEAVCLSRRYDAAHLAKHPQQTVRAISVYKAKGERPRPGEFQSYNLTFRVELKNGRKFEKKTTCFADQYAFACTHDPDLDTVRDYYLTRAPDDKVMLRDRRGRLEKLFDTKLGSDDRIFRLEETKTGCDS
jgi:hypothetical protein